MYKIFVCVWGYLIECVSTMSFLLIRNLLVCVMFRAALVGGVLLGLANPGLGCLADRYYLSKFSTFGIFIISGLSLALLFLMFILMAISL